MILDRSPQGKRYEVKVEEIDEGYKVTHGIEKYIKIFDWQLIWIFVSDTCAAWIF